MLSLRHIVDIRDGTEIEFLLPYLIGVNYSISNATATTTNCSGQLDVTVLNELRAPETCSTAMDILFFFSGGPDFEFAAPGSSQSYPFLPQMGDLDCGVIGGDNKIIQHTINAEQSVGELFSSVKQLLNKYCPLYLNYTPTISDQQVAIWPWLRSCYTINTSSGALTSPVLGGDTFSTISNMYLMYRGGARIMYYSNGSGPTFVTNGIQTSYTASGGNFTPISVGTQYFFGVTNSPFTGTLCANAINVQDSSDGVIFVSAPYYSRTKSSLGFNAYGNGSNGINSDPSFPLNNLIFYRPTDTLCSFWRSFPDDFQCCYFIGAPPRFEGYS